MWSLLITMFWKNCVDEFRPSYNQEKAIGLYLPGGFCLIGLYAATQARQYLIVILNNGFGVWYDEDAEFYQTRQWRLWNFLRGK